MEQQQQNFQNEDGVSLIDIVRLLLGKLRLLVLVVVIGGILGASFAVWKTVDVNYFGTNVEFYVNPEKPEDSSGTSAGTAAGGSQYGVYGAYGRHVMDNMVKLLRSDSFAEKLLLNGNYLPSLNTQWFEEEEMTKEGISKNQALTEAILYAQPYLEDVAKAEDNYNRALTAKADAVKTYTLAETALSNLWKQLYRDGEIQTNSTYFSEKAYLDLTYRPQQLVDAYDLFCSTQDEVTSKNTAALNAEEAWKTEKNEAFKGEDSPVETALNIWRESDLYDTQLSFFKNSVQYDYLESDEDREDANNLARSFIYVTISVKNSDFNRGYAIGEMLLSRVKKVVPLYVAENMTVPDGYSGTNCQRITRTDSIRLTNPLYTTKQAIKYAVLIALVSFVIASLVLIILDKSDKRLRDTEIITRKLNVPLLGVVPTIEELKAEQAAKKKADKEVK